MLKSTRAQAFLVNDFFTRGNVSNEWNNINKDNAYLPFRNSNIWHYRPIYAIFNASEIFWKAMYHHLYGYLEEFKILFPFKFGFREWWLRTRLSSITESTDQSIDNGELGCGIFIDLEKTFDTVNRSLLFDIWYLILFQPPRIFSYPSHNAEILCNLLALNAPKKNSLFFFAPTDKANQSFDIKIDGECFTQIDSVKYLGVIFDSSLTWTSHE